MKCNFDHSYMTCLHSKKRKNAPWKVTSGCGSQYRMYMGKYYDLPHNTVCFTCPFYAEDPQKSDREKQAP